MRELRVEDALMYLDQVKMEFGDRPHIYNEFLDIMKTFKSQAIDTPGVIRRVASLFHGNKRLVLGFNTFLPEGYRIELPLDGSAWPVYREPGRSGVIAIAPGPGPPPGPPGSAAATGDGGGKAGPGGITGPPSAGSAMGRGGPGGMGRGGMGGPSQGRPGLGPPPPPGSMGRGGMPGGGGGGPPMMRGPPPAGAMGRGGGGGPFSGGPGGGAMLKPPPGAGGRLGMAPPPGPGSGAPRPSMGGMGGMQGSGGAPPPAPMSGTGPNSQAAQEAAAARAGIPPASAQSNKPIVAPPPPVGGAKMEQSNAGNNNNRQPVEFDHAINYVTTIKKRFASHPEIYRKFLEILHTYQKEQRGIKEVLDEVSLLFADHADLLKEFTYFLPDAVQSQAKAQLDVAARKAEERARQREAAARAGKKPPPQQAGSAPVVGVSSPSASIGGGGAQGNRVGGTFLPPPPPPSTPGSRGSGTLHPAIPREPKIPSHVEKVPFGATKGRSEDREREISRGSVHGVVRFDPVRPPRRNELNPAQAAVILGRPATIPPTPIQPMTSESCFFEHVRAHFLRRDLFPDKPIVNRKQTPYMEFIKCLHLFGVGILNKDELIQLLRGLFIQGNTPKSGASAQSTSNNTAATHAAMALLSEFEKVLVGRGPFATQEQSKRFRGKYGSYPIREYDFSEDDSSKKLTPSYQSYPSDYVFEKFSGATDKDHANLNFDCFILAQDYASENKGEKYFKSPEDYDGIKVRRNVYEEVMARVEDEMHEVDMAIERNASVMRVLEPIAEEATRLREQEEKDGQPIGRLQYKLRHRALNSIHVGAIARIYGESGEEVLQHLMRNPLVVVPIVYKRLREKNDEWRKVKTELRKEWKKTVSENFTGSLDVKCFVYKKEIELSFTAERLIEECQKAKSFAKHPSKIQRHPATNMIIPDFHLLNPDPELALFQPHLSVLVSKDMPHKLAYELLKDSFASETKKDLLTNIWLDFIVPWFGLPDANTSGDKSTLPNVFTPGQRVRTTVGDGQIVSVVQTLESFRYQIKFPFGVGYVNAAAVNHILPSSNTSTDMDTNEDSVDPSKFMSDDVQVMFATENIYIFMRLYILLVTMLYQAKKISDKTDAASAEQGVMASLQDLIRGKISGKDFEAKCRKNVGTEVYNFVAIPPLVESCADALIKMSKEGLLEKLYCGSQLKLKDLHQQRNLSLDMTDEAIYRLQIQSSASQVFFSYLPIDTDLQLTNPNDIKPSEPPAPTESAAPPTEPDNKRPLEVAELKEPGAVLEPAKPAAPEATVEPEQKRMKTE